MLVLPTFEIGVSILDIAFIDKSKHIRIYISDRMVYTSVVCEYLFQLFSGTKTTASGMAELFLNCYQHLQKLLTLILRSPACGLQ